MSPSPDAERLKGELPVLDSERYVLEEEIGAGVTARVYCALDREIGSRVAIKILNSHLRSDPISFERFQREIRITRQLGHPQIVSVFDLNTSGPCVYLVMELASGRPLNEFIALEHPIGIEPATSILKQLLDVLKACHASHVIHRDLKPQNVMIDSKGGIKLLDFGIARISTLSDLTQSGTSLGSPEYMAPELFAESRYDPRSDLYAVGVMAFEIIAGALPFQGDSLPMLYQQHREAEPPNLRVLRDDTPSWLAELIEKLLAKDPADRYQSADEALLDLEQRRVLARELPISQRRNCLACERQTAAGLAICTRCGNPSVESNSPGNADLHCKDDEERDKLEVFFATLSGFRVPSRRRSGTLLLANRSREMLELIRARGIRHRLYLEIRKAPRGPRKISIAVAALGNLFLYWLLVPALSIATMMGSYSYLYERSGPNDLLYWMIIVFFSLLFLLISLVRGPIRVVRVVRRARPWIGVAPEDLSAELQEDAFLRETAARVAAIDSAPTRVALSRMLDAYLRLSEGRTQESAFDERLRGFLTSAVRIGSVHAEVEAALGTPTQRAALVRTHDAHSEPVRAICQLEDAQSSLMNQMIAMQALFNRILGRRLVLDAPIEAAELERLADSLEAVESEIDIQWAVERSMAAQ